MRTEREQVSLSNSVLDPQSSMLDPQSSILSPHSSVLNKKGHRETAYTISRWPLGMRRLTVRNWNLLSEQLQGNLRKRAYDRLCKPAVAAPPSAKTGGQEYSYTYTCAEGDHRELARILPTVGHRLIVGVGKNLARLLVSLADSLNRLIVGSLNAAADVRSDFTRA